jgi:hypothetical protein
MTINPSGLRISLPTFANHLFGANPIEHRKTGENSASRALIRPASSNARSGSRQRPVKAHTHSSIEHTRSTCMQPSVNSTNA